MKFILSSGYLQRHLQMLSGVINNSNTLPILDNFLFEVIQNKLKITASDLETTMQTELDIESDAELKIAVSAKLLLDILKAIPEQPLTFTVEDNNSVTLSGNIGKYSISYEDAEAFPKLAELENTSEFSLEGDVLATAVQKTIFAAGNDDLRPVMSGVYMQLRENQLTMVATDAHKLVKYTYEGVGNEQEAAIIIPKKPLNLIKSILAGAEDTVKVSFNTHNVCFSWDNTKLISRLIDGKYPNYEAVIPKDNPNRLQIGRQELLNSVRRVSIFASKTTNQIKLKLAGTSLHLSADDIDFNNHAEETLTCNYQGNDMQIGFNSRFLSEMLSNLQTDEVSIDLSEPNRAGILKPIDAADQNESILMLVMPVMIS